MLLTGMLAWSRTRVKLRPETRLWRALRWLPAVGLMGGIFYLSHQSAPPTTNGGGSDDALSAHLALYAALASTLYWALRGSVAGRGAPGWLVASFAFALAVLFGASDELHQALIPERVASETDLAIDAAGAAIGVAMSAGLLALLGRRLSTRI